MSFLEFATHMFPYWCLGAFTFYCVWKSEYRDVLTFKPKVFGKWVFFMACLSVFRYFMLKAALSQGIGLEQAQTAYMLPIGGVFFTPWEDACYSLPLVLLRRMLGTSKWMWPIHMLLLVFTMTSFASGHVYQGGFAAIMISFYIPYAVGFIEKNGAGTIMAGHVLYDAATIMTVRAAVGHL